MEINFGASAPYTVGIEEELQLVDPQSLALVPAIDAVFAARDAAGLPADSVASELSASCVELRSPAYGTVAELAADFPVQRRRLRDLVEGCGARVAAAGAHPFSEATAQEITGKALPQGRQGDGLARTNAGYLRAARPRLGPGRGARHPGRRGALPQRPALRRALGELALLGRVGHPPRLGPREGLRPHAAHRPAPRLPRLGGVRGLRGGPRSRRNHPGLLTVLVGRPHPRLGTVELRAPDAQTESWRVASLAALAQCLVATANEHPPGEPPVHGGEQGAKGRAARYGLDARLHDFSSGRKIQAREAVRALITELRPVSQDLRCEAELEEPVEMTRAETGAEMQRAVYRRRRSMKDVVGHLAAETA